MSDLLTVATEAAQKAGALIKESYQQEVKHQFKDEEAKQIVTETDVAAEKIILETILRAFPDHAYFSEETGLSSNKSEYFWNIDPLDGTTNFVQGINHFCVSIGLDKNQSRHLGVIFDPINNHLFSAQAEQGATLNDQVIAPSTKTDLKECVITINRASRPAEIERYGSAIGQISKRTRTPRILGSTALAISYVACGKLDAFIGFGINYYDGAAASLIAKEAGAVATDFKGNPWHPDPDSSEDLVVTDPRLAQAIYELLKY